MKTSRYSIAIAALKHGDRAVSRQLLQALLVVPSVEILP
jgi:hypothetical protein